LLDEIGRGTSTYDGMSIAEAVMESLQEASRTPLTLFATHYHELTNKADELPSAANYSVLVQENEQGIVFLHTVVNRPADKSYGIQVAKLAGIPPHVIQRAEEILQLREAVKPGMHSPPDGRVLTTREKVAVTVESQPAHTQAMFLFEHAYGDLVHKLAALDVVELTPMEAMNALYGLVKEAQEVVKWDKSK
jgi:DNA mismatch repair protein MutS